MLSDTGPGRMGVDINDSETEATRSNRAGGRSMRSKTKISDSSTKYWRFKCLKIEINL